ncbi:hypothetical protein MPTA5024_17550 [Microbispora sp. ATCC PTA-5024]|nr:hypothetical protein MPTA5024_17550 [Microbispora sp. ATCC PTA-5024]
MATAQETFRQMLRDDFAPALRELGLVGSGPLYRLPHDRHWALLGFQKSAFSTRELVSFTVNLSVVPKERERSVRGLPFRPAASTFYGLSMWHSRIGRLLPGGHDHWWDVGTAPDPAVVDQVLDGVRDFALPAMRRQLDRH